MNAVNKLGRMRTGRSAPPAIIRALKDTDELVRVEAAQSLGRIGDKKVMRALWRALNDPSSLVRRDAAAAIGRMGTHRDLIKLNRLCMKDRSVVARVGFYQALYNLGQRDILPRLLKLLTEKRSYKIRCATAHTLAHVADSMNASRILQALRYALKTEKTIAGASSIRSSIKSVERYRR